ncbi:hypothetical protein SAMN05444064_13044 [Pseudomonas syringae]|uniref:hypothetical protein n=1 Tax=Pseudomonas syringae TaxID=317 RepID=UPI00089A3BE0|nr:hypothetical protein [Pseudomonas syringae]SDX66861.1 hypothetical protein SAMN05444514_13144 [Pseudomonas syringae]SFM74895.1 hypothetical protein SAMN05444064_13044 [Pseudomonas syringae]
MDMMLPLYLQYDSGFGAIANSFKFSADVLEENPSAGGLQSHLPISFLYRHSIELYLKSCIVIFHRRFNTDYQYTDSGEATILVGTKPKLLKDIHTLIPLYKHLKSIIDMNIEFLTTLKNTNWVLTPELDNRVKLIDGTDSSSTFFRYPITKDKPKDKQKSTAQPKDWKSMVENMHNGPKPVKAFLLVDDDYNVIEAFNHDDEKVKALTNTLRETAQVFSALHMMIAWKLVERR